jgi:hypothetical protein
MFGRARLRARERDYIARNEALMREMDALLARPTGQGDAAWDAEMARLQQELGVLTDAGRTLVEHTRRHERWARVLPWITLLVVAGLTVLGVWLLFAAGLIVP